MRRREFVTMLGGAAVWPQVVRAQQRVPRIGFIHTSVASAVLAAGLRRGLAETGYVEGQNVVIDNAFAEGRYDRLQFLADDLVRRGVDIFACGGGSLAAQAAKKATKSIPVVFMVGDVDPVQAGLVASLRLPGGNVTGVSLLGGALGTKRLEILRELIPSAKTIAVLVNPDNPNAASDAQEVESEIRRGGQQSVLLRAAGASDFENAFATLIEQRADALVVTADNAFTAGRAHLTALAARHQIPTIYQWREFAMVGGLISYGASLADTARQGGVYVGRILKGENPADLPVVQPTKFELVINLKTAKALGLEIPATLLARADEVIE